jgi:uncharacterized protein YecT (DUF1311 family)
LGGVAAAAVMGVGLGLWARPAPDPPPEPAVVEAAPEPPVAEALQIVVDDRPAPIGARLVVLPALPGRTSRAAPRAQALPPASLPVIILTKDDPAPEARPAPPVPKADAAPPARRRMAVAAAKPLPAADRPKRKKEPLARLARAAKAAPKAVRAEAGVIRAKAKAMAHRSPVRVAKTDPPRPAPKPAKAAKARIELASAKPSRKSRAPAEVQPRAAPAPCALPDRAEAMVCADSRLSARDRQLQAAYREAMAAGVPATALRRQQVRWLAAREAAAREAPWAVEDVYVARIAELRDLIADAREN